MSTVEEKSLLKKEENVSNIDLLNRQEFIEQLINITEILSKNRENVCYAINGGWGVGKTYVLEKFEKKLRTNEKDSFTLNKYLVFHYNCWQYDYYEEPLIAIVAAILDQIDEQIHLISNDKKELFVAILKTIGISVLGKACSIIAEKSGIDFEKIAEIIKTGDEVATQKIIEKYKFDSYFDFKGTLKKLSETIESLAQEQTIVFVVDELDRCLPEYTIKILERLHHIFDSIPNVQVVLAVDKHQLENTITRIYGEKVSLRRYLAKFIDFELLLPVGEISNEVKTVYSNYYNSFIYGKSNELDVNSACTIILKGVGIRTCKAILEKSYLCHRLLNPNDEKIEAAVLCIEIFLTLLKEYGLNVVFAKDNFSISNLFTRPHTNYGDLFSATTQSLVGLTILSETYRKADGVRYGEYYRKGEGVASVSTKDIWGLLLGSYRLVLGFNNDYWNGMYDKKTLVGGTSLQDYILKYWKLLKFLN